MGQPGGARASSPEREQTLGTETSQYREEEKSTEIPEVAASETGRAQTDGLRIIGVVGPTDAIWSGSRSPLERGARDGDSPVDETLSVS
jgi:hypothetical protein